MDPPDNLPGGTIVIPGATWEECSTCEHRVLPYMLSKEIERVARDRWELLQPEAIKAIRGKTGLSQAVMAYWLGVGEKTYTRWEAGKSYQNKSSDNLIRLIDKNPEMLAKFEAQRRPEREDTVRAYISSLATRSGGQAYAMAAHGAELDSALAERLRAQLRELANCQSKAE